MFAVDYFSRGCLWSVFCLFLFLFLNSGCAAPEKALYDSEKPAEHTYTVTGKVQKISPEEGIMIIGSPKGDRITLKFTGKTPVTGGDIKDIGKFHPVKAVYVVESGENRLVSLEVLPQGSCGGN